MDCLEGLKQLEDNSIDLVCTDPPYGLKFMGKDWDKALPDPEVFKECYRVLKPGCWCLVMSAPRSDLQARMSILLEDAGFNIGFTPIYWTFASGFPKASNLSKMADKRLGKEREVIGKKGLHSFKDTRERPNHKYGADKRTFEEADQLTAPSSEEAKVLDGAYAGFQPKPSLEVVIVAMKPFNSKTYIDQAFKHLEHPECEGLAGSWLDDCRIPHSEPQKTTTRKPREAQVFTDKNCGFKSETLTNASASPDGRFPANLLCSDDILNDDIEHKSGSMNGTINNIQSKVYEDGLKPIKVSINSSTGSFSRYFDLDSWWDKQFEQLPESVKKTYPFILVPKASKSEKNKGCESLEESIPKDFNEPSKNAKERYCIDSRHPNGGYIQKAKPTKNKHPTVKPLKLFNYLITLFSRENQLVLDPYAGSGTTCIAAKLLKRNYIGFELEEEYKIIADARLKAHDTK